MEQEQQQVENKEESAPETALEGSSEGSHKLEHDRPNCIGCAACAAIAPDFWEMSSDGKSDIINCKKRDDGWEELDLEQKDFELNKEAAEACPVNVIHLTDKKTGEKII